MDELSLFTVAILDSRIASREKSFHSLGRGTTKLGDNQARYQRGFLMGVLGSRIFSCTVPDTTAELVGKK